MATASTPHSALSDRQQEGQAHFCVGNAFFNHSSQTGRDLAVLAAIAHKTHHLPPSASFRVLDAMTGCGVRPLRYALEAKADYIWANEGNWDLRNTLQTNLSASLSPEQYKITHRDANSVFFDCYERKDFYDLIDIDSFGSPMPALASGLWAVKLGGLMYLASTDGRATSGHAPDKSLQSYSAYARSHPAVHEQGLRLLIGTAVQQAAARGLSARPVFSWYKGEVNRVMLRIQRPVSWQPKYYGFLAYCHQCGQFQTVHWKKLSQPVLCPCTSAPKPLKSDTASAWPAVSGPMWLGPLHDVDELETMKAIALQLGQPAVNSAEASTQAKYWRKYPVLLDLLQAEAAMPPYYYSLAEIGRRGKMDIPARDRLIQSLLDAGFRATRTHLSAQAIKTDAPIATCLELAQQVAQ